MYAELIGNYKSIGIKSLMVNKLFAVESGAPRRGIKARPFLRPALDKNKEKIKEIIAKHIYRATGRVR